MNGPCRLGALPGGETPSCRHRRAVENASKLRCARRSVEIGVVAERSVYTSISRRVRGSRESCVAKKAVRRRRDNRDAGRRHCLRRPGRFPRRRSSDAL